MLFSTITTGQDMIANKKKLSINKKKFQKVMQYVKTVISMDLFFFITNSPVIVKTIVSLAFDANVTFINDIWFRLVADLTLATFYSAL